MAPKDSFHHNIPVEEIINLAKEIWGNLDFYRSFNLESAHGQLLNLDIAFINKSFLEELHAIEGNHLPASLENRIICLYEFAQTIAATNLLSQHWLPHQPKVKTAMQNIQNAIATLAPFMNYIKNKHANQSRHGVNFAGLTNSMHEHGGTETSLINLLKHAIDPIKFSENRSLSTTELSLIIDHIGQDFFNDVVARYKLKVDSFDLNDLRIIIVGNLVNCQENWENNKFILNLLAACNIQPNGENNPRIIQELRNAIKINSDLTELKPKQPVVAKFFDQALSYLSSKFLGEWKILMPNLLKNNFHFKKDYKTAQAIAEINSWKIIDPNTGQCKDPALQKFASTEFVYNRLSNSDLRDGIVIPSLNEAGQVIFCKVKNFINETNLRGFALIPLDSTKSQEIQIIFKNSNSIGKNIVDLEKYLPYRQFKLHRHKILTELNQIVHDFKQDHHLSKQQKKSIELNIGGHGSGGTLAQLLINEIATQQAYSVAKNYCNNHPNTGLKDLNTSLLEKIKQQCDYETSYKSKQRDKSVVALQKKYENIQRYCNKHFLDINQSVKSNEFPGLKHNHLVEIKNIKLSTVNAGGIPNKIRHNFIQAMNIIKDPRFANKLDFKVECIKIVSDHDVVHHTGNTDLAAYVAPIIMPTKLLKVQSGNAIKAKDNLVQVGLGALLVASKFLFYDCIPIKFPVISSFLSSISYKENIGKIKENARVIYEKVCKGHYDTHLNMEAQPDLSYEVYTNALAPNSDQASRALDQELTAKIPPLTTNILFRKIKKGGYNFVTGIQSIASSLGQKISKRKEAVATKSPKNQNFLEEDLRGKSRNCLLTLPNRVSTQVKRKLKSKLSHSSKLFKDHLPQNKKS